MQAENVSLLNTADTRYCPKKGYCPKKVCKHLCSYLYSYNTKKARRQWNLHAHKALEFISEMLVSEAGIKELIRILLDTFSKQGHALWGKECPGEQCDTQLLKTANLRHIAQVRFFFIRQVGPSGPLCHQNTPAPSCVGGDAGHTSVFRPSLQAGDSCGPVQR